MRTNWMVAAVCGLTLAGPAHGQSTAVADDALRQELRQVVERLDRLEAENAELKRRNENLERRVAELEPSGTAPARASDAAPAAAAPAPAAQARQPAPPAPVAAPVPAPADAPWYQKVKVSGLAFGDAYYVIANHDPAVENQTGFWIRRGYLTADAKVADEWSARLRFEVNSPGDFATNSKLNPYLKDAYLSWTRAAQELYFGLSPSPSFDYVERVWGERQLEKTPLDLYRIASSRDLGVAWKGSAWGGRVFWHTMLGNGEGDGSEYNAGKKVMGALMTRVADPLTLKVYADYEDRPGATDRSTWQVFAGWQGERSRYGLMYASQEREVENARDTAVAVASAFGVWSLTRNGALIARWDRSFDGYPDAAKIPYLRIVDDTPFDLAILGWEQRLEKKISLIPSLEYVTYRAAGQVPAPDDDLYGRLTLYFEF